MKLLITGICGFVGFTLAKTLLEQRKDITILGMDNLIRRGSEANSRALKAMGIACLHGDIRNASDFENLPQVDYVIDAAANPSVLAGVDGKSSSRQLVEHNLLGTVNLLEYCKRCHAGFILLSTSRVYSILPLANLTTQIENNAFRPLLSADSKIQGLSDAGIDEEFSTSAPISLYGSTKLSSEVLALEYGETFGFPVWINRCGVLAGAGQFGKADQGIFAFWIHSWKEKRPLSYIGFDGLGHQVRDCLHPRDLVPLLLQQINESGNNKPRTLNLSGGIESATSLRQLSLWCEQRFGAHPVNSNPQPRPFDLPWVVLDATRAHKHWNWQPQTPKETLFEEIATHAEAHPNWIEWSC